MRELLSNPWVRVLLLLVGLGLLGLAVWVLSDALGPFAMALAIAYFLNPPVNAMEAFFRRHAHRTPTLQQVLDPRTAAVGVLAVAATVAVVVAIVVVVPEVYRQVTDTAVKLPQYVEKVRTRLAPLQHWLDLRYPAQMEVARQKVMETARTHLPDVVAPVTRAVARAFSSVLGFVLALLNLLVIPVFTAYLLYDMNHIRDGVADLVPFRFRPYVYSRSAEVDRLLSAFARGQITVSLILGAFYAVGLTACGVPMGLVAGVVIGFFNLVPFMSYILGLPLALLLSWLDDHSWPRLLAVAAVFTFGQFVEGNFITPRIVGRSLGLHAVVIMLAVLMGGTLFGFVGMLLAVPVTAVLSVFWQDLRSWYLASDFYRGGPAAGAAAADRSRGGA